ncbi:MAG TPA: TetR/AcrR family transcriptional regulator [Acidimicrobiales bacterium]|jgi:AcrR family transcriptional regulator
MTDTGASATAAPSATDGTPGTDVTSGTDDSGPSAEARQRLLDAAEAQFAQEGFHEAAIKDIAERAGMSVGAVYLHVAGKDDLFAAVMTRHGSGFVASTEAIVSAEGTAAERLLRLAEHQVTYFRANPQFATLVLRAAGDPIGSVWSELSTRFAAGYRRAMSAEARLFAQGADDGSLHAGDSDHLALTFSAMVQAFQQTDLVRAEAGYEFLPLESLSALLGRTLIAPSGGSRRRRRGDGSRVTLR